MLPKNLFTHSSDISPTLPVIPPSNLLLLSLTVCVVASPLSGQTGLWVRCSSIFCSSRNGAFGMQHTTPTEPQSLAAMRRRGERITEDYPGEAPQGPGRAEGCTASNKRSSIGERRRGLGRDWRLKLEGQEYPDKLVQPHAVWPDCQMGHWQENGPRIGFLAKTEIWMWGTSGQDWVLQEVKLVLHSNTNFFMRSKLKWG